MTLITTGVVGVKFYQTFKTNNKSNTTTRSLLKIQLELNHEERPVTV